MAATPDLSAVLAHMKKAVEFQVKGHWARMMEYTQRALTAAEARAQDDCLIVAALQQGLATEVFKPAKAQVFQHCLSGGSISPPSFAPFAQLLFPALSTFQRRRAAGKLLPGCCRADEVLYARFFNEYTAAADKAGGYDDTMLDRTAQLAGYHWFLETACLVAHVLALLLLFNDTMGLTREQNNQCMTFVGDAMELIMQPREFDGVLNIEGAFWGAMEDCITKADPMIVWLSRSAEGARLLDAWERLQQSGLLQQREAGKGLICTARFRAIQERAIAAAASAPGLRSCALNTCDAREQHPSHFKCCAACKAVVYCSREHQVQDWSSHKVACKAARKSAAAEAEKK